MASYTNFQNADAKNENTTNVFVKKARVGKKDEKSKDFWGNFKKYVTYYRDNPHRFCVEYLGINLHWWQQVIIYDMFFRGNTIFLASRGTGKTYLTMVYCTAKALLFPGTIMRVAAANKKQAGMLIAKIREIQRNCPLVKQEIVNISIGKDEAKITFHGGSEISTVVAGDGSRGERCQILIVDEREIVDKEVINKVFIPFLTATRMPPYLKKKEYAHFIKYETNHFIELSSIGSKTSSLYKEFEEYLGFINKGIDEYAVHSIPYQIPYSSGVINKKILEKMIRENTTGVEAFRSEMEVIPTGDSEHSMFSFEDLNKNRKMHVPILPPTDDEYFECKGDLRKFPYYQKKSVDELRVLSMDVAQMGGRLNDLSVFTLFSLMKNGDEYIKDISYIETMDGINMELQVLRLKQLFYDLECDFVSLDCGGIGQTLFELATKKTDDLIRGKKYPAWKSRNNVEKMNARVMDDEAIPVVFTVKIAGASATEVHSNIVGRAKLNFEKRRIRLLLPEDDVQEELNKRYKLSTRDSNEERRIELAVRVIKPFIETTMLVNEAIQTQVIRQKSGGITIDEKNGRKDRLMSMLYGLHFIDLLEQDLFEETDDPDEELVFF